MHAYEQLTMFYMGRLQRGLKCLGLELERLFTFSRQASFLGESHVYRVFVAGDRKCFRFEIKIRFGNLKIANILQETQRSNKMSKRDRSCKEERDIRQCKISRENVLAPEKCHCKT